MCDVVEVLVMCEVFDVCVEVDDVVDYVVDYFFVKGVVFMWFFLLFEKVM